MRNLFGWSSPPKRKDRKYSRLRAAALQDLISAKAAHQIYVDIEEYGDGYVVPLRLLNLLADNDGTISSLSNFQKAIDTPEDNSNPSIEVPAGELWYVQSAFLTAIMSSAVADRALTMRITNPSGQSGFTDMLWWSTAETLSASQDGMVFLSGAGHQYYTTMDNGTPTNNRVVTPLPTILEGTATISGNWTNKDTADRASITVYYQKVGEHA